ncbi:MFS transporter [Rhodococcus koreensis]|uniref:MFS transporter n=1 Tax=Rhodococcus koreensis TaxID=99653 RepID=UPI00366A75D8
MSLSSNGAVVGVTSINPNDRRNTMSEPTEPVATIHIASYPHDMSHPDSPPEVPKAERRRGILAAGAGNFIEYYDYLVYGTFATVIAAVFFPEESDVAALLYTFAIFGVSFVARPIGAAIFGHLADKVGRKTSLAWSVFVMVAATLVMGLAPSYATVGVLGSIVLFIGRFAQGIAFGGEFGSAASYIVEIAPKNRRGLYGSIQLFSGGLGTLAGVGIGVLLTATLPEEAVKSWGWRLAFLIGVPLGLIGLYLRRRLEETPEYSKIMSDDKVEKSPLVAVFRFHWRRVVTAAGAVMGFAASAYILVSYIPSYLTKTVGFEYGTSLKILFAGLVVYVLCIPLVGLMSDLWGRRAVGVLGYAVYLISIVPAFLLMNSGSAGLATMGCLLVAVAQACLGGAIPALLVEMFPSGVRASGVSVGYSSSVALFGGTAPLIGTALVASTGSGIAASYYVLICIAVSIAVIATPTAWRAPVHGLTSKAQRTKQSQLAFGDPVD